MSSVTLAWLMTLAVVGLEIQSRSLMQSGWNVWGLSIRSSGLSSLPLLAAQGFYPSHYRWISVFGGSVD